MPFRLEKAKKGKRSVWFVVNPQTGERKNKRPLSMKRAVRYLRALYANVPDAK
jgi:hypothetical protein